MRLLLVRRCFLRLKNREQSYIIKLDEAVGKFTTSHMKWLADMSNEGVSRYKVYLQDCKNAEHGARSNLKPVQSVVKWIAIQFDE